MTIRKVEYMKLRVCAFAAALVCLLSTSMTFAQERIIPPMVAGANAEYDFAGLYYGTLPKSDPDSRRDEFKKLLKDMGIRAIRFPGGTVANTQFLVDNSEVMRSVIGISGWPEGNPKQFTGIWQFLDFCRDSGITPIYQVNTVLYCDGSRVFQILGPDKWFKPEIVRDPAKRADAAKALTALVKKVRARGYVLKNYEMGNEEYGHGIPAADYADIAIRFTRAIHQADPDATVWITLGSNFVSESDKKLIPPWSEAVLVDLKKAGLTRDKNLGFTLHYVWPEYIYYYTDLLKKHSFKPRLAVTEFHMAGTGPYTDLSPRFGYALALAQYLISMTPLPNVEVMCMHELTSQNFGIFHYNQRSYGMPGMETWDASLGYQAMPSAYVFKLFKQMLGGAVKDIGSDPNRLVVELGKERRIFLVNPTVNPLTVRWKRDVVGKNTKAFEVRTLVPNLKPEQRKDGGVSAAALGQSSLNIDPLRVDQIEEQTQSGKITGDTVTITVPSYSVNSVRCFQ